jgi:hypothetical protein
MSVLTQIIVSVTGLGQLLAEKIAAECNEELSAEIQLAYEAGLSNTEILGLIGSRRKFDRDKKDAQEDAPAVDE